MKFDGKVDYMTHAYHSAFDLKFNLSIEAWFKLNRLPVGQLGASIIEDCFPGAVRANSN